METQHTSWFYHRAWPWVLFALAISQFVTSPLVPMEVLQDIGNVGQNPPISPANYAFAIWGPILILFFILATWALIDRSTTSIMRELAPRLSLVAVGYSAWLGAISQHRLILGLIIFLIMIGGLLSSVRVLQQKAAEFAELKASFRGIIRWSLGLYLGWTSAAVWLNVAALFTQWGAPIQGRFATIWQVAVLALAALAGVLLMFATRGMVSVYVAQFWAYVAIIVNTFQVNNAFAVTAAIAVVLVSSTWMTARGGLRELRI